MSSETPSDVRQYYVPVCLYPHTRYRTRDGLNDLFVKFSLSSNNCLILVADRLLALDRLVTGRYWSPDAVVDKARRDSVQVYRLIQRVAAALGAGENCRVFYWDDIANDKNYVGFSERLQTAVNEVSSMVDYIDRFIEQRIDRFGDKANMSRAISSEREYILSEISMSVYCTECLGYNVEVWEKSLPPEQPDPLGFLYRQHVSLVADLVDSRPSRKLKFLYSD